METIKKLPQVPASWFGIVLGLAGLGLSWRVAHRVWGMPALIGESTLGISAMVWATLLGLFAVKWILFRCDAHAELKDAIQSTYISLIGIGTNLMAIGLYPYSQRGALALFVPATLVSVTHGVFFTSFAWSGDRHSSATTGSLYLPTVAGCFVTGTAAATLGYHGLAQLAFGAGMFSWLSIESVILHRLYDKSEMPPEQRPSLGIQFAPAAVAAVTYLSIQGGVPDLFSKALLGYAILQGLVVVRLIGWIMVSPLNVRYWAFTFGAASLSTASCRTVEHGEQGALRILAPILFIAANLIVAGVSAVTLSQLVRHLFTSRRTERVFRDPRSA
ncbi:Tellurite resistance protein TehA [Acidisarcina polymorpha]|uniref:Tellurite resistance protein TehA n=1 Tax=Acidisarcina polymorpha TaxID=2211140 RepID=A0A2Z5G9W0_9BACT|nr:dicarboxylate transporter/tellurite-resistance protein TehA [Acidisarcina polymorpha]AXC15788.1 Tellurite resistance protein TehA [Acidisarcina polymorpha]